MYDASAQTCFRKAISPTGIVNVQPILDAIWLFLLGSCRRLANAAPSPSISSGFNPDIYSADPLASMRRASMRVFLPSYPTRPDYVPDAEHKLRFFFFFSPASDAGCLIRSNSRGYSRERFLASMRRASMRTFLPILPRFFCFKMLNSGRIEKKNLHIWEKNCNFAAHF